MATHSNILAWKIPWAREAWQPTVHGAAKSWTQLSTHMYRNCQTVSQSSCICSRFHQQHSKVPVSPHNHQHLLIVCCSYQSHPSGCEVVSHCGFTLPFPDGKHISF